jgi:hypothetical protein
MVHTNELAPTPIPVIVEVGEAGVVMVPLPDKRVHIPVPVTGIFPVSVVDIPQTN